MVRQLHKKETVMLTTKQFILSNNVHVESLKHGLHTIETCAGHYATHQLHTHMYRSVGLDIMSHDLRVSSLGVLSR